MWCIILNSSISQISLKINQITRHLFSSFKQLLLRCHNSCETLVAFECARMRKKTFQHIFMVYFVNHKPTNFRKSNQRPKAQTHRKRSPVRLPRKKGTQPDNVPHYNVSRKFFEKKTVFPSTQLILILSNTRTPGGLFVLHFRKICQLFGTEIGSSSICLLSFSAGNKNACKIGPTLSVHWCPCFVLCILNVQPRPYLDWVHHSECMSQIVCTEFTFEKKERTRKYVERIRPKWSE